MIILETFQVNEKNTREVQTQKGAKLVSSFSAYPFDGYVGNIWLPPVVKWGDYVTVFVDQIKKEEKDGKIYLNAEFAKVTPLFNLNRENHSNAGQQFTTQAPEGDLFGGSPMEVSDEDLPF